MANSRPVVIISAAMSVDGRIATRTGDSGLSSKKDLIRLHKLRSKVDAVLIGTRTLHRDDPLLTVRHVKGRSPVRIILDSEGTISSDSQILKTSAKIPTIIVVSKSISASSLRRLGRFPVEVIVCGTCRISIVQLLKKLALRKINTLLVEGGGATNWDFVRRGLFDKVIITISPRLVGGTDSISLVQGTGFPKIHNSAKLCLDRVQRIQNELVLYYSKTVD